MNLNTLAKLAGVSVATVSKAFSGSDEISAETRDRIFSLARKLGCFDKYNKNKFEKKVIAVICPELNSNYYNAIITLLNREITARGHIMTVSVGEFSAERERELFAYYSSYCKADGIIAVNPHDQLENPLQIPAVSIGTHMESPSIDSIRSNLSTAIDDAVLSLKAQGHTEIGFVGEPLTMSKLEYFKESMQKADLPLYDHWIHVSPVRFEQAGIRAIEEMLQQGPLPTAILAAYDYIAIGVLKGLRQNGLRCPEDLSVVGMDDISVAPYLETSLSSIRTYTDEACRIAVDLITKKLTNQYYSARSEITVSAEFIPRASTGPAPHSTSF